MTKRILFSYDNLTLCIFPDEEDIHQASVKKHNAVYQALYLVKINSPLGYGDFVYFFYLKDNKNYMYCDVDEPTPFTFHDMSTETTVSQFWEQVHNSIHTYCSTQEKQAVEQFFNTYDLYQKLENNINKNSKSQQRTKI